jgi:hypothetical protein
MKRRRGEEEFGEGKEEGRTSLGKRALQEGRTCSALAAKGGALAATGRAHRFQGIAHQHLQELQR